MNIQTTFTKLLVIFLAIALTSCVRTKEVFLSDYRSFMEEIEEDHKEFDRDDWETHNHEMKRYLEEDFKEFEEDLSNSEKVEVMTDAFRYYFYQHKRKAMRKIRRMDEEQFEIMMDNLEVIVDSGVEFLDEIEPELVEFGEEFLRLGNEFLEEMKDRGLVDKLEDAARKMEDAARKIEKKAKEIERESREL